MVDSKDRGNMVEEPVDNRSNNAAVDYGSGNSDCHQDDVNGD